ncbi:MAG: OmpA family protein [Fibrobacteria bacterium]|nr:OmpA family protein [Fibrobacteria bacterium]
MKLKPAAKFLIAALTVGGLWGAYTVAKSKGMLDKIAPASRGESSDVSDDLADKAKERIGLGRPLKVGVVTWGGYAGGEYFNGGFKASEASRYFQEYGLLVEFVLNDDFLSSREAFKSGAVDLLWTTADAFPVEAAGMAALNPRVVFQADWSRGGDVIVARRGIGSINDIRGKKVAVAFGTPSHTFLIQSLKAADIPYSSIDIVEAPSAIDAASYFKAGKVDAAVVWSPDDADCLKNVPGSSVLVSTRAASNIIADVFIAKQEFIDRNAKALNALVSGWLIGAAEINSSESAKAKAAEILSAGLNQPLDFCLQAINNTRLATYGDNVNFFDLQGSFKGVRGEDLYSQMSDAYRSVGLITDPVPAWRSIIDLTVLRGIRLEGSEHAAEGAAVFTAATQEQRTTQAISTKKVSISYASGSDRLDENAKYIVDREMAPIAKEFGQARIRVAGNTDSQGNPAANRALSERRAKSVVDHLVNTYGFDRNRFVVVGNGADVPVADNGTEEGRAKNRRTEFELLP